jgi:hypothetical protein
MLGDLVVNCLDTMWNLCSNYRINPEITHKQLKKITSIYIRRDLLKHCIYYVLFIKNYTLN